MSAPRQEGEASFLVVIIYSTACVGAGAWLGWWLGALTCG
jgi:hypothetical protein